MTMEATRERAEAVSAEPTRLRLPASLRALSRRGPWLRHWEFWTAVAVGAFLRLWHLDSSQFLEDQAELMRMARDSVVRHAIPLTGIPSSIHLLNPPLSVYVLIPFAVFGKDPFPAIVGLAVWNVFGVVLCYVLAWRYFGRRAAAIATLLFATAGPPVDFSRFLWQQNYLPPLLILWALATFAGALRGSRGWLPISAALLTLAALLHPIALVFLPVVPLAWALAPRKPQIWEYLAAAAALLALVAPTLIWERISGLSDVHQLQQYTAATPQINLDVLSSMMQALGPPTFPDARGASTYASPTATSPYAIVAGLTLALWHLACAIYIVSYVIVTGLVLAPVVRHWRGTPTAGGSRLSRRWRALQADTVWGGHALLWLSVTLVPVAMIRHSSPVHAHYLHILYPLIFILAGVGLDRLLTWVQAGQFASAVVARQARMARFAGVIVIIACIGSLITAQALQSGLYIASQAAGQVDNQYYGYPLNELQTADVALDRLQRQQGATATYISAPVWLTRKSLNYMLVREHPGRVLFFGDCLVLPSAQALPVLLVSTAADSPAADLLALLPNARLVRTLAMPGNDPFQVYRVSGGTPALPHETATSGPIFQDGFGNTLRLDGVARADASALRLRWVVLRMASPAGAPRHFYVDAHAMRSGVGIGPPIAHTECDPTEWHTGATLFTWVSTASTAPPDQPAPPLPDSVAISAWDQNVSYLTPVRYHIQLLTSDLVYESPDQLVAMNPRGAPLPGGLALSRAGELLVSPSALNPP